VLAAAAYAGVSGRVYQAACAGELRAERVGTVRSPLLDEISGAVASRRHPRVLWVHEDSGAGARLYAIRTNGRLVASIEVAGAKAVDWEDIAIGPGSSSGPDLLYLADIGDNDERRATVTIYRFPEPALTATSVRATAVMLRYADGPHDAEALLVDPDRGTLIVITKELLGAGVYTAPGSGGVLRRRGSLAAIGSVTAADVSPDGDLVAVRTYLAVTIWRRSHAQGMAAALRGRGCSVRLVEGQGEALAFSRDGRALLAISEGTRPAILRLR
jgi:hypothetical protein